jgi:hypothetical protein
MKMIAFDPMHTDRFTIQEFSEIVQEDSIMDSDGQGYYGTPTHYDMDAPARPSDVHRGLVRNNGYGYVHWFNK